MAFNRDEIGVANGMLLHISRRFQFQNNARLVFSQVRIKLNIATDVFSRICCSKKSLMRFSEKSVGKGIICMEICMAIAYFREIMHNNNCVQENRMSLRKKCMNWLWVQPLHANQQLRAC